MENAHFLKKEKVNEVPFKKVHIRKNQPFHCNARIFPPDLGISPVIYKSRSAEPLAYTKDSDLAAGRRDESDVIQRKRALIRVQEPTNMVRERGGSLFDGQEVPPPFGRLEKEDVLVSDDEKVRQSRRGACQGNETIQEQDRTAKENEEWYPILKVKGVNTEKQGFYIWKKTFVWESEQGDEQIVSVEDMEHMLNVIVPAWASLHRAMQIESEEFHQLGQTPSHLRNVNEENLRLYSCGEENEIGIADAKCVLSPGGRRLHLGSMRVEKVGDIWYARVYQTVMSAQAVQHTQTGAQYTQYKDIQLDPNQGILIYGAGEKGSPSAEKQDQVLCFNVGKPMRAYAWALKYQQQEEKKGNTVYPVVRSFLVPLDLLGEVLFQASNEHEQKSDISNVDFDRVGNQFAVKGEVLKRLRECVLPGSLVSYSDGIDALDESAGTLRSLSALREEIGIPELEIRDASFVSEIKTGFRVVSAMKENDPRLDGKSGDEKNKMLDRSKASRPSSVVADELQTIYACWAGNLSLLAGECVHGKNIVREFLKKQYLDGSSYTEEESQAISANIEIVVSKVSDLFEPFTPPTG